jgi:hypothetical protein
VVACSPNGYHVGIFGIPNSAILGPINLKYSFPQNHKNGAQYSIGDKSVQLKHSEAKILQLLDHSTLTKAMLEYEVGVYIMRPRKTDTN